MIKKKIKSSFVSVMLTGTVYVFIVALSPFAWAQNGSGKSDENIDVTQKIQDAWIDGRLESAYMFNDNLSAYQINTDVENGVVSLSGKVESKVDQDLAVQIARGVEGVEDVKNNITVASGMRERDVQKVERGQQDDRNEFVQWVNDATITASIKTKLLTNDNVAGTDINVDTERNTVTLTGTVDSEEAKQVAETIAKNTEEVLAVRNNLKVDQG